jgi:hypothetical protein
MILWVWFESEQVETDPGKIPKAFERHDSVI